ncbi:MAG: Kinesin heavy chain [Trizodia sp. TS-e1964]|nr:MAG: Kinesin heavy chain [Trizodia sp. TS-e1964]
MSNAGGASSYNTIKVVARFRPQNKIELQAGGEPVVAFESEETCSLNSKEGPGAFTFDRVFGMDSLQSEVFDFSIRPTVDDILNGYNGTVFAYGQTGAGKSYTMMGDMEQEEKRGVIPRIVEQIFASILASPGNIEYTVRVSYMEIYMERIRDLLAPLNDNLPIHEEKNRGVYVKNLLEIYVSSVQEVYEVMRRGGSARAVAATNMNQESSRSHSIFVITITQKNVETGSAKSGQLFLVDLAGSEKVGKTGASGQTLEEAKKINKSLSALGMVINSLTDGKSTHIPYRDSKLTRILQESLGGNSRTTLIINCSPSSFNDAETLSTLRFGVRAKAIKNKAKINAELSPAELKHLLRKAQLQVTTFENYVTTLEGEVQVWRSGDSVPKERWTLPITGDTVTGLKSDSKTPRPATPSRFHSDLNRSDTPSRPDSRLDQRASTPSIVLDKDEREEFLRRENELQDQIAEKETAVATAESRLQEVVKDLKAIREQEQRTLRDSERLNGEVSEIRMQLEKVSFESREAYITIDGLKEANLELTNELDELKQQMLDVKMSAKETSESFDEKEKKKQERMAKMMASFDLSGDVFNHNNKTIYQAIHEVDVVLGKISSGESVESEQLLRLRSSLIDAQGIAGQPHTTLGVRLDPEQSLKHRVDLEERLGNVEREYEELLERNLEVSDIEEIKARLENAYSNKRMAQLELVKELKDEISSHVAENAKLKAIAEEMQQRIASIGTSQSNAIGPGTANGKTVQQQIAEFDMMKKSLMRDLQNRCERVVELEISLDETREQYNNVLRSSNNKAQQKKMAFLERNLEQLTHVQRQLVEQNGSLKKEVAIAERKLIARNERIQSLESLLHDSQEKLTAANHKFEVQLTQVKDRLEAAKAGSTRGLSPSAPTGLSFSGAGSRIAKPLRGGGTSEGLNGLSIPSLSNLQQQDVSNNVKRSSWFFNQRS